MASEQVRVLIVDDHALHRDGTRRILEQHDDIEVVGDASSGEVALALVNRLAPDVVLMDVRLPGMNGLEATTRITRDHPDVKVIVVTAYDDDEFIRGALEAGAVGFLSKAAPGRDLERGRPSAAAAFNGEGLRVADRP
jgi:DNA-binding NarL/FixJ family response regulator